MKKMRHCVMPLNGRPASSIDLQCHLAALLRRALAFDDVQKCIPHFLGIHDVPFLVTKRKSASVSQLPPYLRVKRRAVEHNSGSLFLFDHLKHIRCRGGFVEPDKLRSRVSGQTTDANDLLFLGCTSAFPLFVHPFFEADIVHAQPRLTSHQLSQIEWKTVRIV